jgi:hypothetical protein
MTTLTEQELCNGSEFNIYTHIGLVGSYAEWKSQHNASRNFLFQLSDLAPPHTDGLIAPSRYLQSIHLATNPQQTPHPHGLANPLRSLGWSDCKFQTFSMQSFDAVTKSRESGEKEHSYMGLTCPFRGARSWPSRVFHSLV